MKLRKCPRCELNYILDDSPLCSVCQEEVHGLHGNGKQLTFCSVCGEIPVLPGQDMCKTCLAEFKSIEMAATGAEQDETAIDTSETEKHPMNGVESLDTLDDLDDGDLDEPEDGIVLLEDDEKDGGQPDDSEKENLLARRYAKAE